MEQDVGIAEQQKVKKQGRDDHIHQLSIQTPYRIIHWPGSVQTPSQQRITKVFPVFMHTPYF